MVTKKELVVFLKKIDKHYPVSISSKVDLDEYAEKILDKATLMIWREKGVIVGIVVGYNNCTFDDMGYISLVGVDFEYRNRGIATTLIKRFIMDCNNKGIYKVHLYTDSRNASAIHMYKKLGFKPYVQCKEPRPQDVHLIYCDN